MNTTTTTHQQQEFFVIQKCWFDGPHVEPPVDYLKLFTTRSVAEQVAHESANAFGSWKQAVVRTILLPGDSSYAFCTAGTLFWVRRVYGTVLIMNTTTTTSCLEQEAHVIVTGGIMGGTGNLNSRRGTEINQERVFCGGPNAQQAAWQTLQSLPGPLKSLSSINRIPIVTDTTMMNPEWLLEGWRSWPLGTQTVVPQLESEESKRQVQDDNNYHHDRPAKRICSSNLEQPVLSMHHHPQQQPFM